LKNDLIAELSFLLVNIACQINHTELYIKSGGDEHQVIDNFRNFLRNKRYFIVIDDIWTTTAWKAIKCAFADNKNGSRIITTAQIDKVSRLSYRHHTDLVVMLGGLSEEE
jgi:hypothetical protein